MPCSAAFCAARSKRRVSLRRLRRGVHGRQRAVYLGFKRRHGYGRRAAVDGTMTAGMAQSLLKAGIGFESTLKMINSAMLARAGRSRLQRWMLRASTSLRGTSPCARRVLRARCCAGAKKTEYLEAKKRAVGILPKSPLPAAKKTSMRAMLVMVSDGVTASGTGGAVRPHCKL